MKSTIYIKYQGINNQTSFDLTTLGESFIGFDIVLKNFIEISDLDGELTIRTEKISEGSVIVHIIMNLASAMPFLSIKSFIDFLAFTGGKEYALALSFFSAFENTHATINDFYNKYPADAEAINFLLGVFVGKMLEAAKHQKEPPTTESAKKLRLPLTWAKKLHYMIKDKKFKKTVKPIVEGEVDKIQLSVDKYFKELTEINNENFENYLPENEKILPELENGTTHDFIAELLAIQSTKGEILKFKINNIDPHYDLLIAHPMEETNTEDYIKYYKKNVNLRAEILRKSLYKRPELRILKIENLQTDIFEKLPS